MTSLFRILKAGSQLGPEALSAYAGYRLGLVTGVVRSATAARPWEDWSLDRLVEPGVPVDPSAFARFRSGRPFPRFVFDQGRLAGGRETTDRALRILHKGIVGLRPGLPPSSWNEIQDEAGIWRRLPADRHWSAYNLSHLGVDVRLLWEPSRFGWVFPLARAFTATQDAKFAEGFWRLWESWRVENPPNRGLQWASAQEVALRLVAITCALWTFAPAWSSRPPRIAGLVEAILAHAERIPPTLAYARAQGNNHLLSEAAGLYTAGVLVPEARQAARWRHVGRELFVEGIRRQVFDDGGYIQHSANYHRLALQLGLWAARLAERNADPLPDVIMEALGRLTRALSVLVDERTGRPARLGPDDGSDLFPIGPADDFRPTLQAAARCFLGSSLYPAGAWDDLSAWMGLTPRGKPIQRRAARRLDHASVLPRAGLVRLGGRDSWGLLRAARFDSRPGHSDQLHVDLHWRGENIALDPGSYLYRAGPPWEGALAEAEVHNTVVVDGADPMTRAGPFLWVDWAQAEVLGVWESPEANLQVAAAQHRGYRGIVHRRTLVRAGEAVWIVVDDILGAGVHRVTLGWNLPDGRRTLRGSTLRLQTKRGPLTLTIDPATLSVYRAGGLVEGLVVADAPATWGWHAPGYGRREPCLRVVADVRTKLPFRITSVWKLAAKGLPPVVEWLPPGEGPAAVSRVRLGKASLEVVLLK